MKKSIGILTALALVLSLGAVAFADAVMSPAEIYSELSGTTPEEAHALKGDGTFGQLAERNGLLEAFEAKNLENKKLILETRVENGQMTREQADALLARMGSGDCDAGQARLGMNTGAAFGRPDQEKGAGYGQGNGNGQGSGNGPEAGSGFGRQLRDGSGSGSPQGLGLNR